MGQARGILFHLALFFSSEREPPRGEPVASFFTLRFSLAASVSLHGASPWHPVVFQLLFCSDKREGSTGQARGILLFFQLLFCSDKREGSTGQARGIM